MRCFVAIELPESLKQRLGRVQQDFDDEGISLVKRGALHITLSFLGDISGEESEEVEKELAGVRLHGFGAWCRGLGFFSPNRINVIFAKIHDGEGFSELYESVSGAVKRVVNLKEERGYVPHVTIARVCWGNRGGLERRIMEHDDEEFGEFHVRSFSLKKSTLTPNGPIYETLREFPLER